MKKTIHYDFITEIENFVSEKFCLDAIQYFETGDTSCLTHSHSKHLSTDASNNFSENSFQWDVDCLANSGVNTPNNEVFGFNSILEISDSIKKVMNDMSDSDMYNVRIAFHKYIQESWGPEHVDRYPYACILYLNDNYSGGELVFTEKDVSIKPKARSIYIFRGIGKNIHKVNPTFNNDRYALVFFWKHKDFRKNREEELLYDK